MKKEEIVKEREEFNNIIQKGKKNSNKYFFICFMPEDTLKFGVAVGTKIGNAVVRNKLKRQMKAIIDDNKFLFKNKGKYIIILKKEINSLNFDEMKKTFIELLKGEKDETK